MVLVSCARPVADEPAAVATDPLPSWNEGAAKDAVLDFVDRVTDPAGPAFVAEPERIAVFDNDGTLWAERPMYFQLLFAIDRVKAMAPDHREWAYDRESPIGGLDRGLDEADTRGWIVIDMKNDWRTIFP
jgi:hypothetical protein